MKTKYWIENLRALAALGVVALHIAALGVVDYYGENSWYFFNFIDSLFRICVPIFVMITGFLLLDREEPVMDSYRKRIGGIIYPFVFWTFFYLLVVIALRYQAGSRVDIKDIFHLIFNNSFYHLWYLYLLIGLYFLIPFLSKVLKRSTNKEILIFIGLWFFSILYYDWFEEYFFNFRLEFMKNYVGYLVLGYYLGHRVTLDKKYSALLFVLGSAITFFGTCYTFTSIDETDKFLFYGYLTFNVAISSVGLFSLLKNYDYSFGKYIKSVSECSFGIYLIHPMILTIVLKTVKILLPVKDFKVLSMMFVFFITMLFSHLFVFLGKKNKILNKIM